MSSPSFDDRDGFIWSNGQLSPWRDVHPHVLSHGLHYGSSVFEGVRAYEGEIFKLNEHTERLFDGTKTLAPAAVAFRDAQPDNGTFTCPIT